MSVLKSELKQLVTLEVGIRVDDALEAALKELSVLEGRQTAFQEGAKNLEALISVVDLDLDAGLFDIPTAGHIKKYMNRCVLSLQNAGQNAMNQRIAQTGAVRGFQHTVELLKGMVAAEKAKTAALMAAVEDHPSENPRERTEGTRPANIKELRLAEEVSEPVAVAPVPTPAPVPEPEPVRMKQRGGRKSRASNS